MALLFFDNFGGYTFAQATRVWNSINGTWTISATGGRFNDSYVTFSNQDWVEKSFPATATIVVGFAIKVTTLPAGDSILVSFEDSGTEQCDLRITSTGHLKVTRNATLLTDGTSSEALSADTWYYIEWKVTIADSIGAGTCKVTINEVETINVATGQDTKNSTNASVNYVEIGNITNSALVADISHIYLDNGTTFLGDCKVETLTVNADGTTQNFTSSSGTHKNDVDDATPDDNTTYVESATVNDIELFGFTSLSSTPSLIHALATFNCLTKLDAGTRTLAPVLRSNGVNYVQTNFNAVDSYKYEVEVFPTDPDTAAAWTEARVNALEAGLKITA